MQVSIFLEGHGKGPMEKTAYLEGETLYTGDDIWTPIAQSLSFWIKFPDGGESKAKLLGSRAIEGNNMPSYRIQFLH